MAGDAQPYQYLVESIRKWHDQVLSCLYLIIFICALLPVSYLQTDK